MHPGTRGRRKKNESVLVTKPAKGHGDGKSANPHFFKKTKPGREKKEGGKTSERLNVTKEGKEKETDAHKQYLNQAHINAATRMRHGE